jgi:hypothetical protein
MFSAPNSDPKRKYIKETQISCIKGEDKKECNKIKTAHILSASRRPTA